MSHTFHVSRAPYPDLKVENLQLSGPNANGTYTVNWVTANRGDGPATGAANRATGVAGSVIRRVETTFAPAVDPSSRVPEIA